ncbi:MAG: hypothetical protein IPO08_22640 [Xanthomonadales bacterium]|nr:hypothetical protein [Xanthomonadales bacterium]
MTLLEQERGHSIQALIEMSKATETQTNVWALERQALVESLEIALARLMEGGLAPVVAMYEAAARRFIVAHVATEEGIGVDPQAQFEFESAFGLISEHWEPVTGEFLVKEARPLERVDVLVDILEQAADVLRDRSATREDWLTIIGRYCRNTDSPAKPEDIVALCSPLRDVVWPPVVAEDEATHV